MSSGAFISHASEDAAYMRELARFLLEYGVPVWTSDDIRAGADWERELAARLADCDAVVVVMTPASLSSTWVAREVATARANDKELFPLHLDGPGHDDLGDVQWEDVSDGRLPSESFVVELRHAVRSHARSEVHDLTPQSGSTIVERPDRLPGRGDLLGQLSRALRGPRGGVVVDLVGVGGVGKTSLARMVAEMARPQFEAVFWISYLNSPEPLSYVPSMLVELGLDAADLDTPESGGVAAAMARLLDERQILVVFDNVETVIEGLGPDRDFSAAHIAALATARRAPGRSCVVFTSRTPLPPPVPADLLEARVPGVDVEAAQRILVDDGVELAVDEVATLVRRYAGNPFALVCAARTSSLTTPAGDARSAPTPGSVSELIREQLHAAPPALRAALDYLALARRELDVGELARVLALAAPGSGDPEVLQSLRARGWLAATDAQLAPVVIEEVTAALSERVVEELERGDLGTLRHLPLLPATLSDGSRAILRAEVLTRVVRELQGRLDRPVADHLVDCLTDRHDPSEDSYATGNVLNLLSCIPHGLDGIALPGRAIRNADLRDCLAPGLDLRDVSFRDVRFDQDLEGVTSVSLSPDGELVAAGTANGDVHLVSATDGTLVTRCVGHRDVVSGLAFSDDSALLATAGDDGFVRVWDSATGDARRELTADGSRLDAVAMTGDGRLVAAGGVAGVVFVWHRGGKTDLAGEPHPGGAGLHVRSLAFDRAGERVAAGCSDGRVRVWDRTSRELVLETDDLGGSVESLVFEAGSGSLLASTRRPPRTHALDPEDGREVDPHDAFRWAGALRLSRQGDRAVNLRSDHLLELIDVPTGTKRELAVPRDRMQFCDVSTRTGRVAAGGDSHRLSAWDWETGRLDWSVHGHSRWIKAVDFSPDGGSIACCADDEAIHVWDLRSMSLTHRLRPHAGHIRHLRFLPGRRVRIVSGSDDRHLAVSDLAARSSDPVLLGPHDGGVWTVAASADGELLAAGCLGGQIRVWAVRSSRPVITLDGGAHVNVRGLSFDASGTLLASCGEDDRVRIWDLRTGHGTMGAHHSGLVWSLDFSPRPGGDLIASAGEDQVVRVWSVKRSEEVLTLTGHRGTIWTTRFSPDGRLLATGSSDTTVRVWPIPGSARPWSRWLARFRGTEPDGTIHDEHQDWVRGVAFSPDGRSIASGSHDGTVRVRGLDGDGSSTLPVMRPYEGLDVRGSRGLSAAQLHALARLGALVDDGRSND